MYNVTNSNTTNANHSLVSIMKTPGTNLCAGYAEPSSLGYGVGNWLRQSSESIYNYFFPSQKMPSNQVAKNGIFNQNTKRLEVLLREISKWNKQEKRYSMIAARIDGFIDGLPPRERVQRTQQVLKFLKDALESYEVAGIVAHSKSLQNFKSQFEDYIDANIGLKQISAEEDLARMQGVAQKQNLDSQGKTLEELIAKTFPQEIIKAFGCAANITKLPVIDIGDAIGFTGYIDFISHRSVPNRLMRGVDGAGRLFLVACLQDKDGKVHAETIFQRYVDSKNNWASGSRQGINILTTSAMNREDHKLFSKLIADGGFVCMDRTERKPCKTKYKLRPK